MFWLFEQAVGLMIGFFFVFLALRILGSLGSLRGSLRIEKTVKPKTHRDICKLPGCSGLHRSHV